MLLTYKEQMELFNKKQIKNELNKENRHREYSFFDLVSKVTVTGKGKKKTGQLKELNGHAVNAQVIIK